MRLTDKRLRFSTRAIAYSNTRYLERLRLTNFEANRSSRCGRLVSCRTFNRSLFPAHLPRRSFLRTLDRIHTFGDSRSDAHVRDTHDTRQYATARLSNTHGSRNETMP